jgi:hypothetical protein
MKLCPIKLNIFSDWSIWQEVERSQTTFLAYDISTVLFKNVNYCKSILATLAAKVSEY